MRARGIKKVSRGLHASTPVTIKNAKAALAREKLQAALAPFGIVVDALQVQQHRFDVEYQAAIDAQKQAQAEIQRLIETQKATAVQKASELEGRRAEWYGAVEAARGEAGRARNEADGYAQQRKAEAAAVLLRAKAESEIQRRSAEALARSGGDAYVKIELAKRLAKKRVILVPNANITTANVNDFLRQLEKPSAH